MINYATRNDYDKISALIFDGNNHVGSGCFLWSRDNSELYCITAYHCTYNTEEKTDYNVRIQYYVNNQLVEPSIVGDRVFEAKDDIAIYRIKVDQYTKQIPHIMISDLSSPPENVVINGFPRFTKCKRCEVRVDYKSNIHGIIYLEAPTLDSNKLERYDEVVGLSGSGCYEVIGNTIKLIGIQNKAINKDVPFKELQGITVEAINKILLANNLPQLPVPIAAFITKPIGSYKPIEQALADYSFKNKWAELDIFQTIKSNVKRHMFSEAMSMYLCGMSGIGKTRGVLYAFKQAGYHNVVYYNSFKNFDNEKHKLQQHTESTNEKFYIIIDEVDFKDFSSTNNEFQFWGDRFKFIFIGTVSKCQMDISCEDTIYLDLIQRKDIIKVISEQYPMFSSEEQEEIYQLSHNDLRLAILISRLYFNDENNSNEGSMPILRGSTKRLKDKYGSAKDILRKTIEQHKSSEPYRVDTTEYFNKLSLFVDIGYKDRVESEITCLAKYFDEKSNGNFRVAIDHLLDINLGIEKLHYFESSPRALSKLAFEEQGWLLIKYNIENFMDTIPNDLMRKRFFDRVDECSMSEEVNEALASWFQSKYKMGALESITYHNAKEVVMYIEHCPSVGLSWLKESILSASPEQLNQFHGTFGRRNVVWTCEHLANFREWFFDCEEILYKLAQNENEKGISNNSQGVWSSMFSPILSNTEVSFYERFELLVSRALQCDKEDEFDMFRVAFTSALNLEGGIRMSPPQMVGGFITPPNWKPQTLEEMMDILKLFLNKVSASFSEFSSIMKKCIIEVLSNTIYNFLPFGLLSLLKEVMNEMLQTQNQKNEFIIKLELQLLLLYKHKYTAPDIISDINSMIDELQ